MKKILKKISEKVYWIKKVVYYLFSSPSNYAKAMGVQLGSDNEIYTKNFGSEPYLISIGNHCQITKGVQIFTHGGAGAIRNLYPQFDCFGKVQIGDYVYIGTNALIMPGVCIGNNSLIAAGSVVSKSVPANVVVGGNPAKIICPISTYIERNLKYNLNCKGLGPKEKRKYLLSLSEDSFVKKKFLVESASSDKR